MPTCTPHRRRALGPRPPPARRIDASACLPLIIRPSRPYSAFSGLHSAASKQIFVVANCAIPGALPVTATMVIWEHAGYHVIEHTIKIVLLLSKVLRVGPHSVWCSPRPEDPQLAIGVSQNVVELLRTYIAD